MTVSGNSKEPIIVQTTVRQLPIRREAILAAIIISTATVFAGGISYQINHEAALIDSSSRAASTLACSRVELVPLSYFDHKDKVGVGMTAYNNSRTMPVSVTCGDAHGLAVRDVETSIRF